MAVRQIGNLMGIVVPGGEAQNGGADADSAYWDSDFSTLDAMRTRLAALDGTTYTTAKLGRMTFNDMVFALKKLGG